MWATLDQSRDTLKAFLFAYSSLWTDAHCYLASRRLCNVVQIMVKSFTRITAVKRASIIAFKLGWCNSNPNMNYSAKTKLKLEGKQREKARPSSSWIQRNQHCSLIPFPSIFSNSTWEAAWKTFPISIWKWYLIGLLQLCILFQYSNTTFYISWELTLWFWHLSFGFVVAWYCTVWNQANFLMESMFTLTHMCS